eukprot:jgi/Undpi1/2984/HiC_scaffold_14.g06361.m1
MVWSKSKVVRLDHGQAQALEAISDEWEDEFLVAMVLSKVATALRAPGRVDLPTVQTRQPRLPCACFGRAEVIVGGGKGAVRAFEALITEEQRLKFHKWVDDNRAAVAPPEEDKAPLLSASSLNSSSGLPEETIGGILSAPYGDALGVDSFHFDADAASPGEAKGQHFTENMDVSTVAEPQVSSPSSFRGREGSMSGGEGGGGEVVEGFSRGVAGICVIAGTPLTNAGFGRASTTSDVVLVTIATSFPCVKGDNNGGHPGFRDGVITGNTARITSESRGGGIAVNILLDTTESGKGAIAFSSLLATAGSGEGAVSSKTYFTTVDSGEDAVAGDPVHLTAKSGDAIGTYHVHGKYYNDRG